MNVRALLLMTLSVVCLTMHASEQADASHNAAIKQGAQAVQELVALRNAGRHHGVIAPIMSEDGSSMPYISRGERKQDSVRYAWLREEDRRRQHLEEIKERRATELQKQMAESRERLLKLHAGRFQDMPHFSDEPDDQQDVLHPRRGTIIADTILELNP